MNNVMLGCVLFLKQVLRCSALSKWSASFQGVRLEEPEKVTPIPRGKV